MTPEALRSRFSSASWMQEDRKVTVIGAGSVGSILAFYLSKQVRSISVYDGDRIEAHNIGTQLFSTHQIGMSKVYALRELLKAMTIDDSSALSVYCYNEPWTPFSSTGDVVFSCVDSIEVRKELFETFVARPDNLKTLFVDVRMAAEFGQVFFVDPHNQDQVDAYRLSLEGDFPEPVCTLKMTIQCAGLMAGLAVQGYNSFCAGMPPPFETYFNGKTFMFTQSSEKQFLDNGNDQSPTTSERVLAVSENNGVEDTIVSESETIL